MTIKDIARISGCSVSTISRVINDRPDVRPETKEHVLKVMREAGFTPNTNARQLKIQQSRSLVFVVKGTRNIFFSDFLVQLQRAATLYGYNGIVSYLDENANEIDAAEKILREIKPKGMIFLGGSVTNFQNGFANISVPSVLATLVSNELDFPNLSMVGVDDRAAAKAAVSHLIAQGHRKIAVLGVVNGLRIYLMYTFIFAGQYDNVIGYAIVVSVSLFFSVILAKLVGGMLPLAAKKLGADPAIMATPFITTIVDACSLILYFQIAQAVFRGMM